MIIWSQDNYIKAWNYASSVHNGQLIPGTDIPYINHIGLVAMEAMAAIGEPWQSFFDPQQLAIELKDIGFTQVEDIGPEDINVRFFNNRTDKLKVGSFGHLMKAKI